MTAGSSAPVFAAARRQPLRKLFSGGYTATVPATAPTDGKIVFLYRVFVYDANAQLAGDFGAVRLLFHAGARKSERRYRQTPEGRYTLEVFAENAYGMRSQPLTASLTVQ